MKSTLVYNVRECALFDMPIDLSEIHRFLRDFSSFWVYNRIFLKL